jgi:hypothetical protein
MSENILNFPSPPPRACPVSSGAVDYLLRMENLALTARAVMSTPAQKARLDQIANDIAELAVLLSPPPRGAA